MQKNNSFVVALLLCTWCMRTVANTSHDFENNFPPDMSQELREQRLNNGDFIAALLKDILGSSDETKHLDEVTKKREDEWNTHADMRHTENVGNNHQEAYKKITSPCSALDRKTEIEQERADNIKEVREARDFHKEMLIRFRKNSSSLIARIVVEHDKYEQKILNIKSADGVQQLQLCTCWASKDPARITDDIFEDVAQFFRLKGFPFLSQELEQVITNSPHAAEHIVALHKVIQEGNEFCSHVIHKQDAPENIQTQ